MRIALDAMGGDHAPGPIVLGAIQAVQNDADMHVVLVGDQAQIEPHLAAAQGVRDRLEIFHATQVITMEESPGLAFRKKPDNSITRCWQLMQQKKIQSKNKKQKKMPKKQMSKKRTFGFSLSAI